MISRTGYLILGLLFEESLTGYLIKKITENRFRFFWNESYGQIYPQLKKLTAEGLVVAEKIHEGGRERIQYTLTESGKNAFYLWLNDEACKDQLRMESILKIYMGAVAGHPSYGENLKAFRLKATASLKVLVKMRKDLSGEPDPYGNHRKIMKMMDLGIYTCEAWKTWAAENEDDGGMT